MSLYSQFDLTYQKGQASWWGKETPSPEHVILKDFYLEVKLDFWYYDLSC